VWWRSIHHNNEVTAPVVPKHLPEEINDFFRGDAFVKQAK